MHKNKAVLQIFQILSFYIKRADIFGVALVQPISQNKKYQQSFIGGITTIIALILSVSYTIWILIEWQESHINPKITSYYHQAQFENLDISYDVIKIKFYSQTKDFIDPFEHKILIPLYVVTSNYNITNDFTVLSYNNTTNELIPPLNFNKHQNSDFQSQYQVVVVFALCTSQLGLNLECANEDLINKFFAQSTNLFYIYVKSKQFNIQSKQIESLTNFYYLQIDQKTCSSLVLSLQTTNYQIQDYLLFGSSYVKQLITGTLMQTQSSQQLYCQQAFQIQSYSSLILVLYNTQIKMNIQYVTAGDLLANIGSIWSSIFLLKHLIFSFNGISLQKKLINELIMMYYPNYKKIIYKRNWRGKILEVYYNQNKIDLQEFQCKMRKIKQQMSSKLSFINLLYEMSRLYFIMRSFQSRESLKKSHLIGINFNFGSKQFHLCEKNSNVELNSPKAQDILNIEDVDLITYSNRQCALSDINEEVYNEQDFFEINKQI